MARNRLTLTQMMQRDTEGYKVNARGTIVSPGKFEGTPAYTPSFWRMALMGCGMEAADGAQCLAIGPHERETWAPLLNGVAMVSLSEDEQGFVHVEINNQRPVF